MNILNTKTTVAIVGAVVAMSLVANAVMAQQAEAGKPRQEFKGPLKVFILAGQSNMQGHAKVSTFEHIGMDPATKPMLTEMQNADDTPKVCERVWILSIGSADTEQTGKLTTGFGVSQNGPKIGPEFTFGLYRQKFTDAPILLFKTTWGGKRLNTDFHPPSAGPYVFNGTQLTAYQKQGKDLAAVLAEKYWDRELTAAKAKENEIKQCSKKLATDGKLTPAEEKAALEKMRTEGLTEPERQVLEKGISNLEFHYLDSAKILGGVGKGLAEAMAEL